MKKLHILAAGLILLIAMLLCATTAAQAETRQPKKTASEWQKEGYIVLKDSYNNFLVLSQDVWYLKEKTTVVNHDSGDPFTLSNYETVQTGKSAKGKQGYCIEAGGKFYFGMKDANDSSGDTLVLGETVVVDMADMNDGVVEGISPQEAMAVAQFTVGAWIDWDPDFDLDDVKIKDIPFYFHGDVHFFLDHWSDSAENTTHHTIQCYFELNMDKMGFATDTETTTDDAHVPIFSYRGVQIIFLSMRLDYFEGNLGVGFSIHDGLKIHFDTWGVVPISDISAERDGPIYDSQVTNVACHGGVEIGFEVGIGSSVKPIIQNQSLTIGFGYTIEGTDNNDRFVPADTKVKWHACDEDECWNEDVRDRIGPVNVVYDLVGFDPWTWHSDDKETDPWYFWYYSKTFDDYGSGECPHYSYRLNAMVVNQNDNPIPNVNVNWDNPDPHYAPQASGTTDNMGGTVIYVQAGAGRDITAKAVSTVDPSKVISQTKTITKQSDREGIRFVLDIPEKHVYFKNSATGETTGWPADIPFMPFFYENVQIPDNVPGLSGRVFTGWNTEEDGSGDSYAPGASLTLSDDLTLWAQWEIAGNSWYVIYNANGGTKAPGPQIVTKGEDAVLTQERPEAGGTMSFKGWTLDRQHPEPLYQPGATLKYDSEKDYVVLYAVWELSPVPEPIHISFRKNTLEEVVLPADVVLQMNSWVHLLPAEAAYGSAWAFVGWSENPQATTPEFLAGHSYYFYRDTTLYAIWGKRPSVTLTFRDSLPDASTGIPNPITIHPPISPYVYIPDQIPQKSGRAFTGWNTKQNGKGTAYAPGSVMTLRDDAVLWAQWVTEGNRWYVIYNANGGTKAPGPQIVKKGENAELTDELPEAGGRTFKGWALSPDAAEAAYQPGGTLEYDSGKNYVVLYAVWELDPPERPVVITFRANGGLPDTVPVPISRPRSVWFHLPESEPIRDAQHLFLGWSQNPDAVEARWKAGAVAIFDQDTTLYAIWSARYQVTEGAGSVWVKGSGKPQRFVADGNMTYFTELRIDGKRFEKGVEITSGSTVADISPWAMETLSEGMHTITFRYEDGEASATFSIAPQPEDRETPATDADDKVLPQTGDSSGSLLWLLLIVSGIAGMVLVGVRAHAGKRKR